MFYKYRVNFYNAYDNEEHCDEGLVIGHDYGTAANHVIDAYGKEGVIDIYLQETFDDEDYCLSKEELKIAFAEK